MWIKKKLNLKAGAILTSLYLGITGVVMIFMGIKDTGSIDLKTPFITGQAKSGFVGIILIFCSVVVTVVCMMTRKTKHKISLKNGKSEFHWEGSVSTVEEFDLIKKMIGDKVPYLDISQS